MTDKNDGFKPLVLNRGEIDPLELIEANRATAKDRDRATLAIAKALKASTDYLAQSMAILAVRDDTMRAFLALPWYRRILRRPPALPPFPPAGETTKEVQS